MRRHFVRGSSTFNCEICGRLTRLTSQATDHLCAECEDICGQDNSVNDNNYQPGTEEFARALSFCNAALSVIQDRGGDVAAVKRAADFIYGDSFAARNKRRSGV
jgi:hypothetical protein